MKKMSSILLCVGLLCGKTRWHCLTLEMFYITVKKILNSDLAKKMKNKENQYRANVIGDSNELVKFSRILLSDTTAKDEKAHILLNNELKWFIWMIHLRKYVYSRSHRQCYIWLSKTTIHPSNSCNHKGHRREGISTIIIYI